MENTRNSAVVARLPAFSVHIWVYPPAGVHAGGHRVGPVPCGQDHSEGMEGVTTGNQPLRALPAVLPAFIPRVPPVWRRSCPNKHPWKPSCLLPRLLPLSAFPSRSPPPSRSRSPPTSALSRGHVTAAPPPPRDAGGKGRGAPAPQAGREGGGGAAALLPVRALRRRAANREEP